MLLYPFFICIIDLNEIFSSFLNLRCLDKAELMFGFFVVVWDFGIFGERVTYVTKSLYSDEVFVGSIISKE